MFLLVLLPKACYMTSFQTSRSKDKRVSGGPAKHLSSKGVLSCHAQSDQSRLEEFLQCDMRGDSHLNTSGSSNPSQNNSAGSQRPAQGVFSRTSPAPSPASFIPEEFEASGCGFSIHQRSFVICYSAERTSRGAAAGDHHVSSGHLPKERSAFCEEKPRPSCGHTYLQCSIGPRPSTLPQSRGLFRASFHHVQRKQ
ncbi:hypothetical protein IRJ41_010925 [Triplophysa rosa]|uniref:Uncharacterized protein n=1 Tax=Triplophysa rosa TaxID=992332 RepID=A0A9W7T2C7_TRIRA|nr:hypothetical protein IRJ41_010925 [Triplophysa rosa]